MNRIKITGMVLAGAALIGAATSPALAKAGTRSSAALPRQATVAQVSKQNSKTPAATQRANRADRHDRLRDILERRWRNHPGRACSVFNFHFCNDSPG